MTPRSYVILLGFDGVGPDSIDPATMPSLGALMQTGAVLGRHRSVFPSETRTALTSLVTGTTPGRHGIVANHFMAPAVDPVDPVDTASIDVLRSLYATNGDAPLGLSGHLARAGLRYAALSTGRAGTWYALWRGAERDGSLAVNPRYPSLGMPAGDSDDLAAHSRGAADAGGGEAPCLAAGLMDTFLSRVWPNHKPALSILWFTEADSAGHYAGFGTVGHRAALKTLDEQLGRLLDWRTRQPERDEIHVLVASDHGQIRLDADGDVDLVAELRRAGFRAARTFDGDAEICVVSGRAPGLWLAEPQPDRLRALAETLAAQPWCGPLFSAGLDPADPYGQVPGTFSHALVQAQHPWSPHLRVTFTRSTAADLEGSGLTGGSGHHGGLDAGELGCLLVADGARIQPGLYDRHPSGLIDVAPTVLSLLGAPQPAGLCGRSLIGLLDGSGPGGEPVTEERYDLHAGGRTHRLVRQRFGRHVYLDGVPSATPLTPDIVPGQETA